MRRAEADAGELAVVLEAGLNNRAASWQRVMPLLAPHVRDVREVIGMVEDLPRSAEAALDLEMDYQTGEPVLDERAGRLRARRREQERAAAEIASDTSELLRRFAAQLSVGDAAVLLGVSKGRISQLRSGPGRSAARRTGTDG